MAQSCELFKALNEEDVNILIEMLKKDMPNSFHVLCFIMNVLDLKSKEPELNGAVYAPNGDYSHSTVFVFLELGGFYSGTYYSETDEGCTRLRDAFAASKFFDNAGYFLMTAVHDRVYQAVGTDLPHMKHDYSTPCYLFGMSPEDVLLKLNPVIPKDVEVRQLQSEDAELVDSLWPHRMEGSVNFIRKVISLSPSVGLYRRSDQKLLSWILKWFYGGLGILQTVEEAKRKGYAQVVVAELSKQLARENWPVHATVLVNNFESNPLFEKMGFKREFLCYYVEYTQPTSK